MVRRRWSYVVALAVASTVAVGFLLGRYEGASVFAASLLAGLLIAEGRRAA